MSGIFLTWLAIGAGLIVAELATGTFYLLVFGLAALAGAVSAYFDYGIHIQLAVAGISAVVGLAILIPYDVRRRGQATAADADLDIGNEVRVETVLGEGRLRVNYRGAQWDAVNENGRAPKVGDIYVITAIRGNTLVVR